MGKQRAQRLLIEDFARSFDLSERDAERIVEGCSSKAVRLALLELRGWDGRGSFWAVRDEILAEYGLVVPEGAANGGG